MEGHGINAWSLSVGEPKGDIPNEMHFSTRGWLMGIYDDESLKDRAFSSLFSFFCKYAKMNSFL